MSTERELSRDELEQVRQYLDRSPDHDSELHGWLRRLSYEVERRRAAEGTSEDHSMKRHGDALEQGSGSRQGPPPER